MHSPYFEVVTMSNPNPNTKSEVDQNCLLKVLVISIMISLTKACCYKESAAPRIPSG